MGNRTILDKSPAWRAIRFAIANDPFQPLLHTDRHSIELSWKRPKIAPIGTKPHALGAVLYAIARPSKSSLFTTTRSERQNERLVQHASLSITHQHFSLSGAPHKRRRSRQPPRRLVRAEASAVGFRWEQIRFTPGTLAAELAGGVSLARCKVIPDFAIKRDGALLKAAGNRWKNAELIGTDVDSRTIRKLSKRSA